MYSIHGELYIYTENSSECLPFGVHVLEPRKHLLADLCVCVRACVCTYWSRETLSSPTYIYIYQLI